MSPGHPGDLSPLSTGGSSPGALEGFLAEVAKQIQRTDSLCPEAPGAGTGQTPGRQGEGTEEAQLHQHRPPEVSQLPEERR